MGSPGSPLVGYGSWGNMMGWGGGLTWWLSQLTLAVWLIVGVLAAIWLFRQISKK